MAPRSKLIGKTHILYDAELGGKVTDEWFDLCYWQRRDALIGSARGRGTAWFVRADSVDLVVRHYRRGGVLAPMWRDRYPWVGLSRTRAWREWHLLATLQQRDLPVPQPVAARVIREGLFYTADIITCRLPDCRPLADMLSEAPLPAFVWQAVGACVGRFHDEQLYHADLNAANILLDQPDHVYLVDFDRARFRNPGRWRAANLSRLRRSLNKFAGMYTRFYFSDEDWEALLAGYSRKRPQ